MFKFIMLVMCKAVLFLISCSDTDDSIINVMNEVYSVKEYALERDPKVNVWGAGMDFVHHDSHPDYQYLTENSVFPYDIKFFIVKVYFKDEKGDTKNGCNLKTRHDNCLTFAVSNGIIYV